MRKELSSIDALRMDGEFHGRWLTPSSSNLFIDQHRFDDCGPKMVVRWHTLLMLRTGFSIYLKSPGITRAGASGSIALGVSWIGAAWDLVHWWIIGQHSFFGIRVIWVTCLGRLLGLSTYLGRLVVEGVPW